MTSTLLKYNVILIVLCIGITLIHNSSQGLGEGGAGEEEAGEVEGGGGEGEGKVIMDKINLYYDPLSPPCRSVLLTLEALNLQFNLKYISLLRKGTETSEFKEMNSLHTIPVLEDGEFVLMESHAIIVYLVREYGGKDNHPLYPNDSKFLAQIDQRLHFDNGTLYPAFKIQYNPWIFNRIEKDPEKEKKIHEGLEFLEKVLEKNNWIAGNSMTVADFALVASISTFEVNGVELKKYIKLGEWLEKCKKTMKGYDTANQNGIDDVIIMLDNQEKKFAAIAASSSQ